MTDIPKKFQQDDKLYSLFGQVLKDGGWIEVEGLHRVPGWENEETVLGKIVWFSSSNEGRSFECGLKFHRKMPQIVSEKLIELMNSSSGSRVFHELMEEFGKISNSPLQQTSRKKVVVVDQDKQESSDVSSFVKKFGFTAEVTSSARDGLLALFFEKPQIIFLNPVFNSKVNMKLLESIHKCDEKVSIILILENSYKDEVMSDRRVQFSKYIFLKPLDLTRLGHAMERLTESALQV